LITLLVLAILIFLPRLNRRLPAALVAVAVGIIAAFVLNRAGVEVKLVGDIPSGLPSFQMPDLSLLRALLPGALGIALMSFTESIAASAPLPSRMIPQWILTRSCWPWGRPTWQAASSRLTLAEEVLRRRR
jgi:MFS superfamily sulfate permease-like transporter